MGISAETPQRRTIGMADALFTAVERRVLGLLFGQPGRRFQSSELIRLADSGTGATHRVVKRLAKSGLIDETRAGRQKYYQANPDSPVFDELVALIRKTVGLAGPLLDSLRSLEDQIEAAFVYGSVASGHDDANSDIDLMVLSTGLDYPTLFDALQGVEKELGRSVDANLLTPAEWRERCARSDSFAARVKDGPRIFVIGSRDVAG